MKKTVQKLMSTRVHVVGSSETLERAAQIMWEHDCGSVPVVSDSNRLCGMLTDRDICMAAYTQGRTLAEISVDSACSKNVHAVEPEATLDAAEAIMRSQRVRRLPVCDSQGFILGILSIADLAGHLDQGGRRTVDPTKPDGLSTASVATTLEAVSQPRTARESGRSMSS